MRSLTTLLSEAESAGADTICVLPSGYPCAFPEPRTPLGVALHAVIPMLHQRLVADLASNADLIVLPPPRPIRTPAAGFSHAADLIHRTEHEAAEALDHDDGRLARPEPRVAMHTH